MNTSPNITDKNFYLCNYAESEEEGYHYDATLEPLKMRSMINNALEYAASNSLRAVIFPPNESFLVETTGTVAAADPVITIPTGITLDLNGSILQLVSNDFTKRIYTLINMPNDSSAICNGTLIASYEVPGQDVLGNNSYAQWGHGIVSSGSYNRIENIIIKDCLGDGIYLNGKEIIGIYLPKETYWSLGSINNNGEEIESNTAIRTSLVDITTIINAGCKYITYRDKGMTFTHLPEIDIAFYDSENNFVEYVRTVYGVEFPIPENATKCRVIMNSYIATEFDDYSFRGRLLGCDVGKNVLVDNVSIEHVGRNGITVAMVGNTTIQNFSISDVSSAVLGSCIDVEEGQRSAWNNIIRNGVCQKGKYGITLPHSIGLTVENVNFLNNSSYAIYGRGTCEVNFRRCIIMGKVIVGSEASEIESMSNGVIENSSVFGHISGFNMQIHNCNIYNGGCCLSGRSICQNSKFYNYDNATVYVCGVFENCTFYKGVICHRTDAAIFSVTSLNNEISTHFRHCKGVSLIRLMFGSGNTIESIENCDWECRRMDITAKKVLNSSFTGLYYGQSTGTAGTVRMYLRCGLIKDCRFERYLNPENTTFYNNSMFLIVDSNTTSNTYIPERYILEGNTFVGLVADNEVVPGIVNTNTGIAKNYYALGVDSPLAQVIFKNNYCSQIDTPNGTTMKLHDVTMAESLIDEVMIQGNIGFEE